MPAVIRRKTLTMDQNHPITVILPVYNTEKYLDRCLDSLLGQTFRDFELLCIDD